MNSPCENCDQFATCGVKCTEFKEWFSVEWRRLRRLFGMEAEDGEAD